METQTRIGSADIDDWVNLLKPQHSDFPQHSELIDEEEEDDQRNIFNLNINVSLNNNKADNLNKHTIGFQPDSIFELSSSLEEKHGFSSSSSPSPTSSTASSDRSETPFRGDSPLSVSSSDDLFEDRESNLDQSPDGEQCQVKEEDGQSILSDLPSNFEHNQSPLSPPRKSASPTNSHSPTPPNTPASPFRSSPPPTPTPTPTPTVLLDSIFRASPSPYSPLVSCLDEQSLWALQNQFRATQTRDIFAEQHQKQLKQLQQLSQTQPPIPTIVGPGAIGVSGFGLPTTTTPTTTPTSIPLSVSPYHHIAVSSPLSNGLSVAAGAQYDWDLQRLKTYYWSELQKIAAQQKMLRCHLMWLRMFPFMDQLGMPNVKMGPSSWMEAQTPFVDPSFVDPTLASASSASPTASHSETGGSQLAPGSFLCTHPGCGRVLKSRFSLRRHISAHKGIKPFKCTFQNCGKKFAESNTLARHRRIHTGEKPFRCDVPGCNRAFSDASNWRRHEASHSGAKPFACPFGCEARYCRKTSLNNHIQKVHSPAPMV